MFFPVAVWYGCRTSILELGQISCFLDEASGGICLLQFCIPLIIRQGRTWEMAGKLSEVGHLDMLIGRLSNCETMWHEFPFYSQIGARRGVSGYIEQVEIDTLHFIGNFPESCEIHALGSEEVRSLFHSDCRHLHWNSLPNRSSPILKVLRGGSCYQG